MPLLFRLEDSLIASNFQSLPRRSLLSTSSDNQICIALIDKLYTFKHANNYLKLNCKINSSQIPRNDVNKYNQLKLEDKQSTYYLDLQKLMCSYCASDNPRFVGFQPQTAYRFVWTCWTPKCKFDDGREACLLCTITLNNSINLWLTSEDSSGTDLYKIEGVLNVSNSLINELVNTDFPLFGDDSNHESAKRKVLFSLSTMGFSSCFFVEDPKRKHHGFLCVLNIVDYILLVWVSKMKMVEIKKETTDSKARRSSRAKRINLEEIPELYEDDEDEPPKRKRKGSEKVLGLAGFSALNKDFYDLDDFDVTKCKELFPVSTKVTHANLLSCKTIAAVKVDTCASLLALYRNDLNFDVYYSDTDSIKTFNLQFDLSVNTDLLRVTNTKVSETSTIYICNKAVECLKHFSTVDETDYELITGFYESTFLVHDLARNVTNHVVCGSLPIVSYSLEHLFMDQGNLALVNLFNSDGATYRLLLGPELRLEIEEVVERSQDFVPCFTASGQDELLVYDCLLKRSLLELNYNLASKSVFHSLLVLLSKGSDLGLFLDYFAAQRSNLVPNSAFFSLTEAPNPFHSLSGPAELMKMRHSEDKFYSSLLGAYSSDCPSTHTLTCFALYLFAFIEASATTPFDKNVSVSPNRNMESLLSKMLRGVKVDTLKLVSIFKTLAKVYKTKFLSDLVDHLSK